MKTKVAILLSMVVIMSLLFTGCDNNSQIKGVKEKGKLEEEPEISVNGAGKKTKKMKLEKYIAAVVAGEMKKDWPEDAYGAQAILARTYALKHMEDEQTETISGSFAQAQQYKPEAVSDEIKKAVKKTRGEVVLYDEQYIKAWYHASAGGETTTAKVGLGYEEDELPYIKSIRSPDDEAPEDIKNWTVEFKNNKLIEALSRMGKAIGGLKNLTINNKDQTGRAINFKFKGDKGEAIVNAADFRKQLDPKKLKSIKLESVKKTAEGYSFSGSGFGHGVGMSQWGAYSLAQENKSPEEIIKHYFNDIEIVRIYD
jgi:stage II sporulation protein D